MTDRSEYEREAIQAIISPYLQRAVNRIKDSEQGEDVIGSSRKPEDHIFPRQASRYSGEFVPTKQPEPWSHVILGGLLMVAAFAALCIAVF